MTAFNSPLLNKLEDLARETKWFLSSLQSDGSLALTLADIPRTKSFMTAFSGYIFSSQTAIHRQIINMDARSKKNELPDKYLLHREISDNLLALPASDYLEIYKSRISKVIDIVWEAEEEVSKLREESETLLPALRKASEWWAVPANREATLSKVNSLDMSDNDTAQSIQIQLNSLSSLQIAITFLESLPSNLLFTYWILLTNSLGDVSKADHTGNNEFKEIKWAAKTNKLNKMPLEVVESWFIQLAETNSKNGNPFLTVEQVEQFIERAFVGISFTEKLSMNEKQGDKRNVIGLFHLFYTHCITHQPKIGKIDSTATAQKYISLLTDHFDNWTFDEVKENFRRAGNWKKPD